MPEKRTILIIDDIDENIDILERRLNNVGFNIFSANSGQKGLQLLKSENIDLVLLDINMPELDGITVLANIRNDQSLSNVAVVMVTAQDDAKTVLECLKKGACGYITKPYSMERIILQIENCLE